MQKKFNFTKSVFVFIFLLGKAIFSKEDIVNKLDHKNSQLDLYLDLIKYNTYEKLGILPYILNKKSGTYLEVGTGGDPIADLLSNIPEDLDIKIIASDIDENILNSLVDRHPILNNYLNKKNKLRLKLKQLDATDAKDFKDESLDGINASAVLHEIISYAGGLKGLESFFKESFRILKKDGVLIYRDPEFVYDKNEIITLDLKSSSIKLFTHIFLSKFLDQKVGLLSQNGRKFCQYSKEDITYNFYKKNKDGLLKLSQDEYLVTKSYEIDFSRSYFIDLPRGLCREIERHYLTYLHQCNPLAFVKLVPNLNENSYYVNFLAHSTKKIVNKFLKSKRIYKSENLIDINTKSIIEEEICLNQKCIEYGIIIHFRSKLKEKSLRLILNKYGFDDSHYIIPIKDNDLLLDYRIFALLYDEIINLFDSVNRPINENEIVHAQYLKREGEETYFYYSDDELITKVAKTTISNDGYMLCPVSPEQNKFIPRLCYTEMLNNIISITDKHGYSYKIKEGKRIIHFQKMEIKKAFEILQNISDQNRNKYQKLTIFLEANKNRICS